MSPQQDWAREALEGAVEARLDNGDRALMLVVGSGLRLQREDRDPARGEIRLIGLNRLGQRADVALEGGDPLILQFVISEDSHRYLL